MESTVLSTALDKLKNLGPGEEPALQEDEVRALTSYLSETASAATVTASEQVLCRQIRSVLQARATRAHSGGPPQQQKPEYERSNNALRAAIDLFLVCDFASVRNGDLRILRDTEAQLQAMARREGPSPNQVRLAKLISRCLANYNAWVANQPSGPAAPVSPTPEGESMAPAPDAPPSAPDAGDAPTTWTRDDLLAALSERELLEEIEGVATRAHVRAASVTGDLIVDADCPEDIYLHVEAGGVTIRGAVSGFILADGDINVTGNITGGWLFSRHGNIRASRSLAAANLIAPRGTIGLDAYENSQLIFSGGACHVAGDGFGATVHADDLIVDGTLQRSSVYVRGKLEAGSVEVSSGDRASFHFRVAQSCLDYGAPLPEAAFAGIRNVARLNCRAHVTPAWLTFLASERLNLCRARLYILRADTDGERVARDLRRGHGIYAALQFLVEAGESLKVSYAMGECLEPDLARVSVTGALEEAGAFIGLMSKEAAAMVKEYVGNVEAIESACRHINSFSKKLKEAMRADTGLDKLLPEFDARLDEWRRMSEEARVRYGGTLTAVKDVLGESVFDTQDAEKLAALCERLETQVPESRTRSPEMRVLKQRIVEYSDLESQWRTNAASTQAEYDAALTVATESAALKLARRTNRYVEVRQMGGAISITSIGVNEKRHGRDGSTSVLSTAKAPYRLRCENLRLYAAEEIARGAVR